MTENPDTDSTKNSQNMNNVASNTLRPYIGTFH